MAVLEKGEAVLDAKKESALYKLVDFTTAISDKLGVALKNIDLGHLVGVNSNAFKVPSPAFAGAAPQQYVINIGDTIINGGNEDTVRKHEEVSRRFVNEIFDKLNIKR